MKSYDSFYVDIAKIHIAHEFVLNEKNSCAYPSGRKYCGIIYCIAGEAEYKFSASKRQTVKQGDILLLAPDAAYSILVKNEFKHYTINFETHSADSASVGSENKFCLLSPENTDLYYHHFKNLIMHRNAKKIGSEMQATACLYELLALILSEIHEKKYHTNAYLRLQPAKEYIEHHFKENITLHMLANLSDMSVSHFRREWVKQYRESALQYRDKIRLRHSKEYLNSGYYTVSEIASKCGFDDVNYFIRFFKKHTGISPGKYAKIL